MRQLQPVLWTKGLFVSPQHLQTQDRFFEDNLGFQLSSLTPWRWGFERRTLDAEALARGEVVVVEATGTLPDGSVFASPEADGQVPPRMVATGWGEDRPTLTVFLALPELRSDGRNVALSGEDAGTRFLADVIRRRDEVNGLAERQLEVARKNLRLVFETESLEGFTSLPLIRLVRGASGEITEDPSFIPPLVSTVGSPRLQSVADRLVELLAARGASLSTMRRQRSGNLAHFSVSDVANFWLLYTINSFLPVLQHLAQRRAGHPAELYETMIALAGSLTTFSSTIDPNHFPPYAHSDCGPVFLQMEELIRTLVESAVPEHCVALALRQVDPTTYAASIDDERLLRPVGAYLAVRADQSPSEIARQVPLLLKVSSTERVADLIRQALPGAALSHVASPPSAIPLRLDAQYFEIVRGGKEWESVLRSRNLAAHVPTELGNASIELVLLLPESR